MSSKSTKFMDFFQGVLPGGVVRSDSGTAINVSSNGTSTVPAKELEKVIFKRFGEMKVTDLSKPASLPLKSK
jgi:hypothetical protein